MAKELKRSVKDKMIAGVCGGLAEYFEMDSSLMRVIMVLAGLFSVGVLAYIIMWVVVPEAEA